MCREGCSGSIFLSVQYEECEDIDAIESTRAKVGSLALDLLTCESAAKAATQHAQHSSFVGSCLGHVPWPLYLCNAQHRSFQQSVDNPKMCCRQQRSSC